MLAKIPKFLMERAENIYVSTAGFYMCSDSNIFFFASFQYSMRAAFVLHMYLRRSNIGAHFNANSWELFLAKQTSRRNILYMQRIYICMHGEHT